MDLTPSRASFTPGEDIRLELDDAHGPVTIEVWHLDRLVTTRTVDDDAGQKSRIDVDPLPVGGYGVVATSASGDLARTAFDVVVDVFDRPRYGFVADYPAGLAPDALATTVRELHLNLVQFYDWAHRYAQLVPDTDDYVDPLNRSLSLTTVRTMTAAVAELGSTAMGYAAVYAVGGVDWDRWQQAGLFKADGQPHRFTDDLLLVVDPSNEDWMAHFGADLRAAMDRVGFTGFHLDSYGWPKRAYRADGSVADLNEGFATLLDRLRVEVPDGRLLFNNVNDFPTWSTTRTQQDGTYIEVWSPHDTLQHIGALVDRARSCRPGRVPIIAAYLTAYRDHPAEQADAAARLLMATVFSHGATHLLNGAGGTVLVDPYYPTNHVAGPTTLSLMRTWYDFLVRYGDLLLAPDAVDVTRSYTGGINEELLFDAGDVTVATDALPGRVWVRVVRLDVALVVHLIDLTAQTETAWDAPKTTPIGVAGVRLRILRTLAVGSPLIADPDGDGALHRLDTTPDGLYDVVELPTLGAWTMLVLPDVTTWEAGTTSA